MYTHIYACIMSVFMSICMHACMYALVRTYASIVNLYHCIWAWTGSRMTHINDVEVCCCGMLTQVCRRREHGSGARWRYYNAIATLPHSGRVCDEATQWIWTIHGLMTLPCNLQEWSWLDDFIATWHFTKCENVASGHRWTSSICFINI